MRWVELLQESTSETLFHKNDGKIASFSDLPQGAKNALMAYFEYEEEPLDERFGYTLIPIKELVAACWNAPDNDDMRDYFPDWDTYHHSYWKGERDADYQNHLAEMWPVILDDREGILDGWHRLHWYYRNQVDEVPAILLV